MASFEGLTGFGSWIMRLGERTRFNFSASRRPLPSNFQTFYIDNEVRVEYALDFARHSTFAASAAFGRNRYGDPILECGPRTREDDRVNLRSGIAWNLAPKLGLNIVGRHENRDSNCEEGRGDYDVSSLEVGIVLGWF